MGQRLPKWGVDTPASLDDATLVEIAKIQTLEVVDLQEARLSFVGLSRLKALPALKTIRLKWVDVSEADISKLRKELPDVTIEWEPLTGDEEQSLLVKKLRL